jgi:hypothetical protein
MGSEPTESKPKWPASRIVRLVVPPLVALLVAWAFREHKPDPVTPPERHVPSGVAADGLSAPAAQSRLLLLGENAGELAEGLRPKLRDDVGVLVAPIPTQSDLMRTYGVTQLPAVVVERPGAEHIVRQGEAASLQPVLKACSELGLLDASE